MKMQDMAFSLFKVSPPRDYSIAAMTIETSHSSLELDSKLIGNLAFPLVNFAINSCLTQTKNPSCVLYFLDAIYKDTQKSFQRRIDIKDHRLRPTKN